MDATTNPLVALSQALADAVEAAGAGVLTVEGRRRLPATGIAWTADTVVTCNHVLERDENIRVRTADGRELAATIAGRDPGTDLAVLRVPGGELSPVQRGDGSSARTGSIVLALGRPGAAIQASLGVISSVGGAWRTFRGHQVDGYLRTDATFFPGFSGGPLVDGQARVVGVNSSRLGQGAGLSLPIAVVERVAAALLSAGRIRRGYLGINSQQVKLPNALTAKAGGRETGLLVVQVEPGSPAERGGILLGDIVIGIAGVAIASTEDLQAQLGPERVDQPTPVAVLRGGELRELTVVIGERQ